MGGGDLQCAELVQRVAALLATCGREDLLCRRSVPSVVGQSVLPEVVVIVADGIHLTRRARAYLADLCGNIPLVLQDNRRAQGAAGAWNTGIDYLAREGFSGFVAVLDDDDHWDPDHLEVNLRTARAQGANLVVSGLRMHTATGSVPRPLIRDLSARDILVGNPGWQGSNTFVDLELLRAVGGFTDGLPSLNDRDLAFRLLRHSKARPTLTGRWTATWYCDTGGALSEPKSVAKREGLRRFWGMYSREMTADEEEAFFERARRLFGIPADVITAMKDADLGHDG